MVKSVDKININLQNDSMESSILAMREKSKRKHVSEKDNNGASLYPLQSVAKKRFMLIACFRASAQHSTAMLRLCEAHIRSMRSRCHLSQAPSLTFRIEGGRVW